MPIDHIAIELLASTPFSHDVNLKGNGIAEAVPSLPNATHIATVEHLPPTLSLQYFFLDPMSKFHPYTGFGVNYIIILDEDLSSKAEWN
ncbi:MAG: outer membrane protein [Oceanicoccus sp.]|jgi:outer membrane protein